MPTDRQISQLVLQVDANIAVAQRDLQNLARVVNQTSGQMNTALGSTAQAHTRLSGAFNQSRIAQMELSHVMTASVDAYAAGASPLRILTLEMGRVAQAASFMGGGNGVMGKLGAFMGGPWGIAVLLATNVLAQLIGKFSAGSESIGDLVQKMREHAKEAEKSKLADEAWANSIDGLIDRNEKLVETLNKRLTVEGDIELQQAQAAERDRARAEKAVTDAQNRLNNLQAQQRAQAANPSVISLATGAVAHGADPAAAALAKQVEKAQQDLAQAKRGLADAEASIVKTTITLGQEEGKALADLGSAVDVWARRYQSALTGIETANNGALAGSSAQLTEAFTQLKKAMSDAAGEGLSRDFYSARTQAKEYGNQLASGSLSVDQYTTKIQALVKALVAAAEAAKNAKKGAGEFGKQISFADAESIAKSAGLTVTSGFRSEAKQAELYRTVRTAENPVARPGTSAHEGVNGKWALDIAFEPGLTPQKIRKIYGDQGVSLSAIYKETGHFHIEGSRSQAASQERAAQAAQVAGIKRAGAFDQATDRLNQELLQAQSQLTSDYNARAGIADKQIDADTEKLKDSIQEQLDLGKATDYQQGITEAQAKILRAKVDELDSAKKAAVEQQRQLQALDSQQETADQQYGFQLDGLKFADEMAKTADEHRRLQLQILDIQYAEKQADLQILLAKQKLAGLTDDAARTQAEINNLPTEKARDTARVNEGTLNPLQQYFHDIPHTAAEINQALQSIEVEGIQGLANALAHVGEGWSAMRDIAIQALQDIASKLIQLGIDRMLFSLFGNSILGGLGGGGGFSALGSGLNFGTDFTTLPAPHLAGGGWMPIGGLGGIDNNVLSLNGRPLAMVSRGETLAVIPSRIGQARAANTNTVGGDHYHISVAVNGGGSAIQNRQTGLQVAAGIESGLARRRAKGTVG